MNIPQWLVTAIVTLLIVQLLRKLEKKVWRETTGTVTSGEISSTQKAERTFYWIEAAYKFKPIGDVSEYSGTQKLSFWCGSMEEAERTLWYAKSHPVKIRYNVLSPSEHEIEIATNNGE